MEIRMARFLSYLLHPLLLPTYATLLLLNLPLFLTYTINLEAKMWLVILVFGFTFLLPVTVVITMYYFRMINNLEFDQPGQRTLPLLFAAVSYYALLYLLRKSGLPAYFLYFIYGALFVLLAGLLINLAYKISLHALAWGAAVTSLIGISVKMGVDIPGTIIISIVMAGLAGFARLKLNAHNPVQVYVGFGIGAGIITVLTFFL